MNTKHLDVKARKLSKRIQRTETYQQARVAAERERNALEGLLRARQLRIEELESKLKATQERVGKAEAQIEALKLDLASK